MKKEFIRPVIVGAVVLVVYLLLALVIPFVKTATFWVSFVFTLLSFAVVSAAFYIAFMKKPDAKSRFYGFPIARLGAIYGLFQLIAGFLFMLLAAWVPAWIAVLVYAVAMGAAVVGLVSADAVVEEIEKQDHQLKADVSVMRGLQSKVNQMASQCEDADAAKAVKDFAEELRYSDPVSSEALGEVERDLSAAVDELQNAVVEGDAPSIRKLCRKASAVLAERNRLCKLNK